MRGRNGALVIAPLLALALVVLLSLGTWQLARNDQKQQLEADRRARIAEEPYVPGSGAPVAPEELEYRRVSVAGEWDHGQTLTISRFRFGIWGEEAVVPLAPDGGGPAILVNLGWYPVSERERVRAALAQESGGRVEGLARYVTGGSARETSAGTWSGYHVASMAAALPYAVEPWGLIAGEWLPEPLRVPPPDLPVQGFTAYENDVPHMEYAITWFGLAAALVATAYLRLVRGRSRDV